MNCRNEVTNNQLSLLNCMLAFPLLLTAAGSMGQAGTVSVSQKISNTEGNFTGTLDDQDYFGRSVAGIGDLNNDGIPDLAVGADYDDDKVGGGSPAQDRGAVWILFMNSNGTVNTYQKISDTQGNFTGGLDMLDYFGFSTGALGDHNGGGTEDLAVGAFNDDDGGTNRGAVYMLFLNTNGTVSTYQKISDIAGGFTGTLIDNDFFGMSVADIGDLDNDGVDDLAVGASGDDDGGTVHGAVWILFMNSNGTVKSHQKISDTQGGFTGVLDDYDEFGYSVAKLGDLDGDLIEDVAVGAMADGDGGLRHGAVWILFLNTNGTVKSHQKISDLDGNFTGVLDDNDRFGTGVALLGDIDADGIVDISVGARGDDDGGAEKGAIWVLMLNTNGTVKTHQKISSTEGSFSGPLAASDLFGQSITIMGDLNGDGEVDIAVGAYQTSDGGPTRGGVWVIGVNHGTGLPVELVSFTAEQVSTYVSLKWTTAVEINNDYFLLQRSADGVLFSEIGRVKGAGNSNMLTEYSYNDNNPSAGISYYRLRQVDIDGVSTYSGIQAVNYASNGTPVKIYPNPVMAGQSLNIEMDESSVGEEVLVVLFNQISEEVYSKVMISEQDGIIRGIPLNQDLRPGVYYVVASSNNNVYRKKLIINSPSSPSLQ